MFKMQRLEQDSLELLQQTIQNKYSKIFHKYQKDFVLILNKIKQSVQNLNLVLEIEEKDTNNLSLDLLCDIVQLYLARHTDLTAKKIRKVVYVNFDHLNEFKQDQEHEKLKIQLISLTPQLLSSKNPKIKELTSLHVKSLTDFYRRSNNTKILAAFMDKLDQATEPNSYNRNITIFQNDLNINKTEFFKFVDSLKWVVSDLTGIKENCINLWSDTNLSQSENETYAVNIEVNNAMLNIVKRITKIDIKNEYEAKHFAKVKKTIKGPDLEETSNVDNFDEKEEISNSASNDSNQFVWGNEPIKLQNQCSLCSHFEKVTDRPKTLKDSIVINPKGQYQYRICMKTSGQITVILSQPIKYCPQCGRKLN